MHSGENQYTHQRHGCNEGALARCPCLGYLAAGLNVWNHHHRPLAREGRHRIDATHTGEQKLQQRHHAGTSGQSCNEALCNNLLANWLDWILRHQGRFKQGESLPLLPVLQVFYHLRGQLLGTQVLVLNPCSIVVAL